MHGTEFEADEVEYQSNLLCFPRHRNYYHMSIDHALRDDLQKSEDRFATAFHANPLATVITSLADGRFIDCNYTYCRLTGYRREELLGTIASALPIWDSAAER